MTRTSADADRMETIRRETMQSLHEDLVVPDGFRAQIIGADLIVSGPPTGQHAHLVALVRNAVQPARPIGHDVFEGTTAQTDGGERYTPDLALWPLDLLRGSPEWILPAAQCRFALEVTAPGSEYRDYKKASGYAEAGVPVYLLIDVRKRECVLFTDPEAGQYRGTRRIPFGTPVFLPIDGRPVTIDTSTF